MNRSRDGRALPPADSALQHAPAPRPLPLFLELVREAAGRDPALARGALAGLAAYSSAPRPPPAAEKPIAGRIGAACLRDHGGNGPPVLLVPSLINPPHILDLDPQVSLAAAMTGFGRRVLLLDWGEARDRAELSVSGHVAELLVPLIAALGEPPALVGYCLGGTMAIAAANLVQVERVATLAAPWHFAHYPAESRDGLERLWSETCGAAQALGALPMEVLQAAFWSLDPERTVAKFARFARLDPGGPEARRFVALEDWANLGEPLPYPAARELIEDFFLADVPGSGSWRIAQTAIRETPGVPLLHLTAGRDRIAPAETAPGGDSRTIASGHVGMVVGSKRALLHDELARFLSPACR